MESLAAFTHGGLAVVWTTRLSTSKSGDVGPKSRPFQSEQEQARTSSFKAQLDKMGLWFQAPWNKLVGLQVVADQLRKRRWSAVC
ncbi:hypothetical protein [Hydrogenophaga laconesensis]|uniref:Uncharacterized protein n=1 Tax=Hydrogenophaga laconesensis TaxID=1805971 RepID=A0ABU1VIX1_9BURK|nr:hypothetical protein [Hydrogenophaga laconesensis]MDR7097419.1 hypothetical protein [Hydrogenophaga laconesensis]